MSTAIVSSFIEGSPPGELTEVSNSIKALMADSDPSILQKCKSAFQKYNESQLVVGKVPGGTSYVLVSKHNRLDETQYYDTTTSTSFTFDHLTQKVSASKPYTHDSPQSDLISSTSKALSSHFSEHYPSQSSGSSASGSSFTVSDADPSGIAILISATKSSPSNFLSGRWRTELIYNPSSQTLSGTLSVQVHYYEDGNVALQGSKKISESGVRDNGADIVRAVAKVEKSYQEEVNRGLAGMNEGAFRALRRQLPVTRQRIEWEKVRGYSLSDNLKGK